jgi:hypothetical protein
MPQDLIEPQVSESSHPVISSSVNSPTATNRSRSGSPASCQTDATTLPALQQKSFAEDDQLGPLNEEDIVPGSFDLVAPPETGPKQYSLEQRSLELFSSEHLKIIFESPTLLLRFTDFLNNNRASSVPILAYYLDAMKALKALAYSNSVAAALESIPPLEFTRNVAQPSVNTELEERAKLAFDVLVQEELPAFITHTYIQTVSQSMQMRITGTLPIHLRVASEGLGEVFTLTDPSRPDNPIVFASERMCDCSKFLIF